MNWKLEAPMGEIDNDALYYWIQRLAGEPEVRTICEIGSGDGTGSTRAILAGAEKRETCQIALLETRRENFSALHALASKLARLVAFRQSSSPIASWMSAAQVRHFYESTTTMLNRHAIEQVLTWLDAEIREAQYLPQNGIQQIKTLWQVGNFDLVILDGCPFSGDADLDAVYGSRILVMDDTNDIKNHENYRRLMKDGRYNLVAEDQTLRNGYAIFRR